MKKTGKTIIWTLIITVLAVVLSLVAMTMGRYHISISQIFALFFPTAFPNVEVNDTMRTVILNVRLPRVLLALIAGAGLSVSGAAFQALFSNPLATPDVLGVATAASFGAALGILFGLPSMGIQILALIAGLIAVAIVWIAGSSGGRTSLIMIILSGMMVSAFFSAMVSLIKYTADPQDVLPSLTFWLMGSLSGTTSELLILGTPFILIGIVILWLFRWKLNAMTLSEDEATALGINVKLVRAVVIVSSTMITAAVVSMCGLIGWVGLLIPHVSRMIFGNNNKYVIPASIGLGGVFMLVIDTIARCLTSSEIPVSILTAVIGAPFFIVLMRKTGGIK